MEILFLDQMESTEEAVHGAEKCYRNEQDSANQLNGDFFWKTIELDFLHLFYPNMTRACVKVTQTPWMVPVALALAVSPVCDLHAQNYP
jgi:hypothetical protein